MVEVVDAGVEGDEPGVAAPEAGAGATPVVAYVGLGLGALALVVALLALLLSRRKAS